MLGRKWLIELGFTTITFLGAASGASEGLGFVSFTSGSIFEVYLVRRPEDTELDAFSFF